MKYTFECKECGNLFKTKDKRRKFCTRKCYFSNPKNNPFFGKEHSEESKDKIGQKTKERYPSSEDNPFFGKKHSKKSREQMSTTRSEKIANGEINPIQRGKIGYFNGLFYHSSYELKRIMDLISDTNVISIENCKLQIPYFYNGNRIYNPDLKIVYKNNDIAIEEIKGYESKKDLVKYESAISFCLKEGFIFRKIYKKDLFKSEQEYRKFLKNL